MFCSMSKAPAAEKHIDTARSIGESKGGPSLPAKRAFVLQFAIPESGSTEPKGRVEHVVSGSSARFESWQALRGFIESTLSGPNHAVSEVPTEES
jgi:hypothetical protein